MGILQGKAFYIRVWNIYKFPFATLSMSLAEHHLIAAIQSEIWSTVLYTVPDELMSEGVKGTGDITNTKGGQK